MESRGLLRHMKHEIALQKPHIIDAIENLRNNFNQKSEQLDKKDSPLSREKYEAAFNKLDQTREVIKDTLADIESIKSEFDSIGKVVVEFSKDIDNISRKINRYNMSYGLQGLAREKVSRTRKLRSPEKIVVERKSTKTPHNNRGGRTRYNKKYTRRLYKS